MLLVGVSAPVVAASDACVSTRVFADVVSVSAGVTTGAVETSSDLAAEVVAIMAGWLVVFGVGAELDGAVFAVAEITEWLAGAAGVLGLAGCVVACEFLAALKRRVQPSTASSVAAIIS